MAPLSTFPSSSWSSSMFFRTPRRRHAATWRKPRCSTPWSDGGRQRWCFAAGPRRIETPSQLRRARQDSRVGRHDHLVRQLAAPPATECRLALVESASPTEALTSPGCHSRFSRLNPERGRSGLCHTRPQGQEGSRRRRAAPGVEVPAPRVAPGARQVHVVRDGSPT